MNWILLIIIIASAVALLRFAIRLVKGLYRILLIIISKVLNILVSITLIISGPIIKLIKTVIK